MVNLDCIHVKVRDAGVVVTTLGYWRQLNKGKVNSISSAEFGDMGNSASVCDSLVEVGLV